MSCCICGLLSFIDTVLSPILNSTLPAQTEDRDVCGGAMSLMAPVLGSALRDMSLTSRLSNIFCASVFGLCDYPAVDQFQVPTPPSPRQDSRTPAAPRRKGHAVLKVAHFSDIHVDPLYVAGSNANCTKPMCCRFVEPSPPPTPRLKNMGVCF